MNLTSSVMLCQNGRWFERHFDCKYKQSGQIGDLLCFGTSSCLYTSWGQLDEESAKNQRRKPQTAMKKNHRGLGVQEYCIINPSFCAIMERAQLFRYGPQEARKT